MFVLGFALSGQSYLIKASLLVAHEEPHRGPQRGSGAPLEEP